jgi:hypothetical protein
LFIKKKTQKACFLNLLKQPRPRHHSFPQPVFVIQTSACNCREPATPGLSLGLPQAPGPTQLHCGQLPWSQCPGQREAAAFSTGRQGPMAKLRLCLARSAFQGGVPVRRWVSEVLTKPQCQFSNLTDLLSSGQAQQSCPRCPHGSKEGHEPVVPMCLPQVSDAPQDTQEHS